MLSASVSTFKIVVSNGNKRVASSLSLSVPTDWTTIGVDDVMNVIIFSVSDWEPVKEPEVLKLKFHQQVLNYLQMGNIHHL